MPWALLISCKWTYFYRICINSCCLKTCAETFFLVCRKYQVLAQLFVLPNLPVENILDLKRKLSSRVIYRLSTVHVVGVEFTPKMHQMKPFEADIIKIFWGGVLVQRPSASAACYSSHLAHCSKTFWLGCKRHFGLTMSPPCFKMSCCPCTASKKSFINYKRKEQLSD